MAFFVRARHETDMQAYQVFAMAIPELRSPLCETRQCRKSVTLPLLLDCREDQEIPGERGEGNWVQGTC